MLSALLSVLSGRREVSQVVGLGEPNNPLRLASNSWVSNRIISQRGRGWWKNGGLLGGRTVVDLCTDLIGGERLQEPFLGGPLLSSDHAVCLWMVYCLEYLLYFQQTTQLF